MGKAKTQRRAGGRHDARGQVVIVPLPRRLPRGLGVRRVDGVVDCLEVVRALEDPGALVMGVLGDGVNEGGAL